eukprot:657960_1
MNEEQKAKLEDIEPQREKNRRHLIEKHHLHLIGLIDSTTTFSVQVLEFSESMADWFIMRDVANCNFTYSHLSKFSYFVKSTLPEISLLITEVNKASNVICSVVVNADLQWTILSETELFCSFFPPRGNAVGVKFHTLANLKVATDIVQQVTGGPPAPPKEEEPDTDDINLVIPAPPKEDELG